MEYSYTLFKGRLSEALISKSKYIDRAMFKALDFSKHDLDRINELQIGESIHLNLAETILSSKKFSYYFSKLESLLVGSSRFILKHGGKQKLSIEANVTRETKSRVSFDVELDLKETGNEEYVVKVNKSHDSAKFKRNGLSSFSKSYLDRKNFVYSLSKFFNCRSNEVEYHLDEHLMLEDMSKPFPYTYNMKELTKFCLMNLHGFKELDKASIHEKVSLKLYTSDESLIFGKHKNINLLDTGKWRLSICRQGQRFQRQFDDLDEAINVRDEVFKFYEEHDRLPSYAEAGFEVKEDNELHHISYHKDTDLWKVSIRRNGKRFNAYDTSLDKVLILRSKVETFISIYDRIPTYEEIDFIPISKRSDNHNLYYSESTQSWNVTILRDNHKFKVYVDSLEEATEVRDKALEFYKLNSRLPSQKEIGFVNRRDRKLDMSNVTYHSSTKHYAIRIQRNNQLFRLSTKSLRDATQIRDKVLKFYDDNGRLPSKEEINCYKKC